MKLDEYMLDAGHDDRSFAELVGVSREAVSRWRRGKRCPEGMNMVKVVRATSGKVTANDFLPDDLDGSGTLLTTSDSGGPDTSNSPKSCAAI